MNDARSGSIAAPLGWPVMAHGLDQFITGISTAFTGGPRDTLTSQLLQKAGMSHQTASFIEFLRHQLYRYWKRVVGYCLKTEAAHLSMAAGIPNMHWNEWLQIRLKLWPN